jgi:hypothetical protein
VRKCKICVRVFVPSLFVIIFDEAIGNLLSFVRGGTNCVIPIYKNQVRFSHETSEHLSNRHYLRLRSYHLAIEQMLFEVSVYFVDCKTERLQYAAGFQPCQRIIKMSFSHRPTWGSFAAHRSNAIETNGTLLWMQTTTEAETSYEMTTAGFVPLIHRPQTRQADNNGGWNFIRNDNGWICSANPQTSNSTFL